MRRGREQNVSITDGFFIVEGNRGAGVRSVRIGGGGGVWDTERKGRDAADKC